MQLYEQNGSTTKAEQLRQRIARSQKRLEATTAFVEEAVRRLPWAPLDAWRAAVDNRALGLAVDALTEFLRANRASFRTQAEWRQRLGNRRTKLARGVAEIAEAHWSIFPVDLDRKARAGKLIAGLRSDPVISPLFGSTDSGSGPRRTAQFAVSHVSGLSERLVRELSRKDGTT